MIILESIKTKHYSVSHAAGVCCLGTIISLTGIVFIGTAELTTLTCQRSNTPSLEKTPQGSCTLTTASAFTPSTQQISLIDLQEAKLERFYRRPYQVTYQVVLLTQAGEIPITSQAPTKRNWKAEIAADINQFLQTPQQPQLQLQLENPAGIGIFGFLLAIAGTATGLFSNQIVQGLKSSPEIHHDG